MENKFKRILHKYGAQLYFSWVLFIGLLTLVPGTVISGVDWNFLSIDKLIHFTMFLGLAFLGVNFFISTSKRHKILSSLLISLIIAVGYGTLIEYAQTFIPQRGFDYADLTANFVGTITGVTLYYLYFVYKS